MNKSEQNADLDGIMHCPLCGRELVDDERTAGGWECRCGEFVPDGLSLNSFQGCTHGMNCNCGRERRG
jgi:hypothetical protein